MSNDLSLRLLAHAVGARLFPEPGRALLAVSGGPDSVAMLDLFTRAGPDLGLALAVAHVDHGITVGSSAVARQVRELAARAGLPFYETRLTLGPDASETAARLARYRALRALQRAAGARYLVTAHHADDQEETVLFRVLRGSGAAGMAGIPERGPGGLVRPLLPFRRAELARWAAERGLPVHDDPANRSPRHDRVWIRHTLLPELRGRYGPALDWRLLRVADQAGRERGAWQAALRAIPALEFRRGPGLAEVARAPLGKYDNLLSEALLRALGREVGAVVGYRRAERLRQFAARAGSGRRFQLGGGFEAEIAFDRLRILSPMRVGTGEPEAELPWGEGTAGRVRWSDWEISWVAEPAGTPQRASLVTWVTSGPGRVRGPAPGDAIVPLGGVGRRRVRRLLMEARVARSDRTGYPILERAGAVLWVPGVCRAATGLPARGATALRLEAHAL